MLKHWRKPTVLALIGTFVVLHDDGINIVLGELPDRNVTYMTTVTSSASGYPVFASATILEPKPPKLDALVIKRPLKKT